jgi:pimeloyl-ACP methyl ester carboxylesterase
MNQQKSTFTDHFIPLTDGRRLGYSEYGAKHGTPVLFFHGAPGSSYIHQDLAAIAAQKDVRLIAVDRPGYGLSEPQPNRTFLSFAEDINALTNTLGIKKFSIIGFSAGSTYPLACAYKFSERINKIALVSSLAPVNVPGVMEGMSPMAAGLYALAQSNPEELRKTFTAIATSASALIGVASASIGDWDKEVFQARTAEFELEYEHALRSGIEGIASDYILFTGEWGFPINECNTEVHLYSGNVDENTPPAMTHYLSTQLPNSHIHQFQNEGHFILYPHWEEILRAVI